MDEQHDSNHLTTLEPREEPGALALIQELKDAVNGASSLNLWNRLAKNAKALNAAWDGKQDDGRQPKPSEWVGERKSLFRWEGAPDIAIPLVDILVRWLVRLRVAVWNRGDARIQPQKMPDVPGAASPQGAMAGVWQAALEFFLYIGGFKYAYDFELAARCCASLGYSVLLCDWEKRKRKELKTITLQQLTDVIMQSQIDAAGGPDQVDINELRDEVGAEIESLLNDPKAEERGAGWIRQADPQVSKREAKLAMKALRKKPGEPATYFVARDDGGVPTMEALIPGVQCIHSPDMDGKGRCDLFATPMYGTRSQIEEMAAAEGWDKEKTQTLIDTQKNKLAAELLPKAVEWALNGVGINMVMNQSALNQTPHWLVFRVWRKITDEDGLALVYRGVLHPGMGENGLLKWEPTDLEEIPIIVDTNEPATYAMLARGVGDVVVSHQNAIKDTMDSEGARGRLGSNPPFIKSTGVWLGMKPGLEIDGDKLQRGMEQRLNRFMDVPVVDSGALKISAEAERWANLYYCHGKDIDPDDKRLFMEDMSFKSLRVMCKVLMTMWVQIQENITELHASSVAGKPVKLDVNSRDQLAGAADIHVAFHLDGLIQDKADKFVDSLIKLMQADRTGRIDWGEMVDMFMQMRMPMYARRLLKTKDNAAIDIVTDQASRHTRIANGDPTLSYEEHAVNPEMRLQLLQAWQSIPDNAPQNQTVADLIQKEWEYLNFQVQQQTTNATTGRTGVAPNDAGEMAQQEGMTS